MSDVIVQMKLTHPPGTINQNNVMLSKAAYEKALDEILHRTNNRIPVTCFTDYANRNVDLSVVPYEHLIGYVDSKDDVMTDIATVHLSDKYIRDNTHMDISKFIDKILTEKNELMLRWIGTPSPSLAGHIDVKDVKIISFDIGDPRKIT